MIIDKSQEKLIQAIIFFVLNTKNCFKVKLFKLLYFLDFQHYQEVGRSVTSLEYFAWKMGPVPVTLFNEIKNMDSKLTEYVDIAKGNYGWDREFLKFTPKIPFNPKIFSKRELKIMKALSDKHYGHIADQMIEETHLENLPWHQVFNIQGNRQKVIPYEYALKKSEQDIVQKLADERIEMKENYDKAGNSSL